MVIIISILTILFETKMTTHPLIQITCGLAGIAAMYYSGEKIGKNYSTLGAYSLAMGAVIDGVRRIYATCMRKNDGPIDYAQIKKLKKNLPFKTILKNPERDLKLLFPKHVDLPYYSLHEGLGVPTFFKKPAGDESKKLNEAYLQARINTGKNVSAAQPTESDKINSDLKMQAKKTVKFAEVIASTRIFQSESD